MDNPVFPYIVAAASAGTSQTVFVFICEFLIYFHDFHDDFYFS